MKKEKEQTCVNTVDVPFDDPNFWIGQINAIVIGAGVPTSRGDLNLKNKGGKASLNKKAHAYDRIAGTLNIMRDYYYQIHMKRMMPTQVVNPPQNKP